MYKQKENIMLGGGGGGENLPQMLDSVEGY